MIRIGVIEDDSNMRKIVSQIIEKEIQEYEEVKQKTFESAEEFLQEKVGYDIVISDIELPGINGIELGKRLSEEGKQTKLIYLTSYPEYAWESYLVEAFQYILKIDMQERLPEIIRKVLEGLIKENKNYRIFGNSYKHMKLYYKDIIYIQKEKEKKYTDYITKNGKYRERISFNQILHEIDDSRFIPIDRGHAINIQYIDQIDENFIYLETEEKFKVSRVQLANVKKKITEYWRNFA